MEACQQQKSWQTNHPGNREYLQLGRRAYRHFEDRDYAPAATLYQQAYHAAVVAHAPESALNYLNGLGGARFAMLDYDGALNAFIELREASRRAGNRLWFSTACSNLCSLYMQIGDTASARTVAEQGLQIPNDGRISYRSQFMGVLGLLASGSGDDRQALSYFRDAVSDAEIRGDDRLRFEAWSHYAQGLFHAGYLDDAETAGLNMYRLGGLASVREPRPAYLLLARIHRSRGKHALSLALIERGLAVPARRDDRQLWRMYFLYERAMLRSAEGRLPEAASDLRLALRDAHNWREAIAPSDSLRSGAEFWLKDVYDAYIEVATKTNSASGGFLAVEEERAASLVQMLAASHPPGASERSSQYWVDLARLRTLEIARIANPAAYDAEGARQIALRISEADARKLATFNRAANNERENLLSRNTLNDIQRRIAAGEAVLSLHLSKTGSFLWAVTSDSFEMHQLPARATLEPIAERFRTAVQHSAPERDRLGAELYSGLFGSLSARVLAKRSWIVTSDDSLFEVPFGSLVVRENNANSAPVYLVERHDTHRIPTALLLAEAPSTAANGPFLAVGDGIYNTADKRWTATHPAMAGFASLFTSGRTSASIELPRLVSSTYELESCAAAWNPNRPPILLTGARVSRAKIVPALRQNPAVIHIAAHVLSPNGRPDQALIHLGLTPGGAPEVLTTSDVTGLRTEGALVVLSGCSSAAGNSVRGTGVLGLTRAWLLAGARAVVGSRWPVADNTGDLFRSFYSHLASSPGRTGYSSALQQAKLDMLRSGTWRSDPNYWGAFYLVTKD